MTLEIIQVAMLEDNYGYLLYDKDSQETAVVDPSQAAPILTLLKRFDWRLKYIFNTHHHIDHVGGNLELQESTGAKIVCSKFDVSRIAGASIALADKEQFHLGQHCADIFEIPGHTLGHIAYHFADSQALFCGDTLFSLGCGKIFEGTAEQMWNSLCRLKNLPPDTKIYCGHEYTKSNGNFARHIDPKNEMLRKYCVLVDDKIREGIPTVPSTLSIELECNPFLRAPTLKKQLGLLQSAEDWQAFSVIRELKNNFNPRDAVQYTYSR